MGEEVLPPMTPMDTDENRFDGLTERIIAAAFKVHNALGAGFYEKVYETALTHQLRKEGMLVEQQLRYIIHYDGVVVGEYVADFVVEKAVLIEAKAVKAIDDPHLAQAINFVTASKLPIGLVLNFGQKVGIRRIAGPSLRQLD